MSRPILLDPTEIQAVLDVLVDAARFGGSVRVWDDEGSFKIKLGFGAWSPPLGVVDPNGGE